MLPAYCRSLLSLLTTLTALLLVATSGFALDSMPPGSLKAYAVAAENSRYIERWASSNPEELQDLQSATRFAPGETAYTAVIVTGYSRDEKGHIDLDAGFRFYSHDNRVLFRRDAYAQAKRKQTLETGFIMLDPALDIGFDPQDPAGDYRLEFEVTDKIAQRRTLASVILTLDSHKYSGILEAQIDDARILDELWRYYDQSQDAEALKRMISILHWAELKQENKKLLGEAANWSLSRRAGQSPAVYTRCQQLLDDAKPRDRIILEQILNAARAQSTLN